MTGRRVLAEGLCWPEGARRHADAWWFSDVWRKTVHRLDDAGTLQQVVELADHPSGLGWSADGTLLVVLMHSRVVAAVRDRTASPYADLTGVLDYDANDLTVDAQGRGYVTNLGMDLAGDDTALPGVPLVRVEPDGSCAVAAADLTTPNGIAVCGNALVVSECMIGRLTAFDLGADGTLANRRTLHQFDDPAAIPDGLCADDAGRIWAAVPTLKRVCAFEVSGAKVDEFEIGDETVMPVACAARTTDVGTEVLVTLGDVRYARGGTPDAGLLHGRIEVLTR